MSISTPPTTPATDGVNPSGTRVFLPFDRFLIHADRSLKTLFARETSARPYPAAGITETLDDPTSKRHVAALMRVNHSGEVAAQALYQGHSFVAAADETRASMEHASREEADHLAWCAARIEELGGRTSVLAPLWYAGSFAIGAAAGLAGDRYSLGFVAETERQVVEHLESHLRQLPQDDLRTRAVLEQMSADEAQHGRQAEISGGISLPNPVRWLMKVTARVMTRAAYWL